MLPIYSICICLARILFRKRCFRRFCHHCDIIIITIIIYVVVVVVVVDCQEIVGEE